MQLGCRRRYRSELSLDVPLFFATESQTCDLPISKEYHRCLGVAIPLRGRHSLGAAATASWRKVAEILPDRATLSSGPIYRGSDVGCSAPPLRAVKATLAGGLRPALTRSAVALLETRSAPEERPFLISPEERGRGAIGSCRTRSNAFMFQSGREKWQKWEPRSLTSSYPIMRKNIN